MVIDLTARTSRTPTESTKLLADPRVGEQVLDDDDAADQILDVLSEHLHARPERIRHRVARDDRLLTEAVQAGHLDVVGTERLDHPGAHHSHRRGQRDPEQRQHGQDELVRLGEWFVPGGIRATGERTSSQLKKNR